jgi:hypothetical protein
MKIRITQHDTIDGLQQPLVRDTFFCERENGRIDLFGKTVLAKRCWMTSWWLILDIDESVVDAAETVDELAAENPFKQPIQCQTGVYVEEYLGCKVEKVADDFDWRTWVV